MLQMTGKSFEEEAEAFVSEEKEVASVADAIAGTKDIIAEHISDEPSVSFLRPSGRQFPY